MSHSLSRVFVHLVWATKGRVRWIGPAQDDALHAAMRAQCDRLRCESVAIGGVEDHVHVLCRLAVTVDVASLVRACKSASSLAMRRRAGLDAFEWQVGYGALSVDGRHVDQVAAYVLEQRLRHARNQVDPLLETCDRTDELRREPE